MVVRYPGIRVKLGGMDEEGGNAFAILGRVTAAMRASGVADDEVRAFVAEATAGDYFHLRRTATRWVLTDVVEIDRGSTDCVEE